MSEELRVTFQPSGRSVFVLSGTVLLEAAARAGFVVETPCGGAGKCGKCVVRVTSGECSPCGVESGALSDEQVRDGYRLACACKVNEELIVEIPQASLFEGGQKILAEHADEPMHIEPSIVKRYVELPPATREDPRADAERLRDALDGARLNLDVLRDLPNVVREEDFRVTATIVDGVVVRVQAGNQSDGCYGLALDIGTTTLVATLVELTSGTDLAVASMVNPQTSHGDDVVSRIGKCRGSAEGLSELQSAVRTAVNALIEEVSRKAGVAREEICEVVAAGNTTMQQIFCGINPRSLSEIPFSPTFHEALSIEASELGIGIHRAGTINVFPQIGGFVGGDTVAGIIATRMDRKSSPVLLVDVGTNGEIVLANEGRLVATSVAAGPAFEGARIAQGMRATEGAIEKVVIDGDVRINVIGNAAPSGLCGTGLIDATAAMLRCGVLDTTGRILSPEELPTGLPDAIRARVVEEDGEFCFVLAPAEESSTGRPVCLFQKDIRELQLANGAIRAGIGILLRREGVEPGQLGMILLAGAFGNFIRRKNACRIGMLPRVPSERIRFVGNTASFGAKRALLSRTEKEYAQRVRRETRHVDLSLDPDFQMEFGSAMLFPDFENDGSAP